MPKHFDVTPVTEIWKPIPGFEGSYAVSNLGRVKSLARVIFRKKTGPKKIQECIRVQTPNKKGYLGVGLSIEGKVIRRAVQRLVAAAFVPNPMSLPEVDHVDTNKKNNRADNLEWVTSSENKSRSYKHGRDRLCGEKRPWARLTEPNVISIRERYDAGNISLSELADEFTVKPSTIHAVVQRRSWKHVA